MQRVTSGQRPRTCRACGKKFEYPVKGSPATRHHCEHCVNLPADILKTFERLTTRITQLEHQLRALQPKPAPTPAATAPEPAVSA
jgi:hypothetical protein